MARGRMLNKKVAVSGKVARYGKEHGPYALVFHHRLVAFLDKNGNCRADGYWLKGEIMPRIGEVTPDMCMEYVAGLIAHELAVPYEVEGMHYIHMPGFRGEQVGLRHDRETREVPIPAGFDEASGTWSELHRSASARQQAAVRMLAG